MIDFTEIPEAHLASGAQDTWEIFAADFLEMLGYKIVERPSRGPDLGKDLIVVESRIGVGGETQIRWLVSCKHKAHTKKAVGVDDELNIVERIEGKGCDGFITFCSTLPSSALALRLKELEARFEIKTFDWGLIEKYLLADNGAQIAARYFPSSFKKWRSDHPRPANLFSKVETLECEACGKNLIQPTPTGIFVLWHTDRGPLDDADHLVDSHWCCKGECDRILEENMHRKHGAEVYDGWDDIADLCVPLLYIRKVMSILNGFQRGDKWSAEAFQKVRTLLVTTYQHVARDSSAEELERIQSLMKIPDYIGGLGTDY